MHTPSSTTDGNGGLHAVVMTHVIPAGLLGPTPTTLDVRAYLVPHATGLVLIDTGMDPTGQALDAAVVEVGADWSDISHVLISHNHVDHVGALAHVRHAAAGAQVLASPLDRVPDARPVTAGDKIGALQVLATPGHTPGHLSFLDQDRGLLFIGDCLGVSNGRLVRAPVPFTADPDRAEETLHTLRALRVQRMLFAHGPELIDPWAQLDALLDHQILSSGTPGPAEPRRDAHSHHAGTPSPRTVRAALQPRACGDVSPPVSADPARSPVSRTVGGST